MASEVIDWRDKARAGIRIAALMAEQERRQALLAERDAEIARLRESIVRAGRAHPDGGLCWCGVVTPHHWPGCASVRAALAARGGEGSLT